MLWGKTVPSLWDDAPCIPPHVPPRIPPRIQPLPRLLCRGQLPASKKAFVLLLVLALPGRETLLAPGPQQALSPADGLS